MSMSEKGNRELLGYPFDNQLHAFEFVMERLIYRSKATSPLGSLHLFNLLKLAREKNAQLQITGHLLYLDDRFTQCIEGPAESIDVLWQSLLRDDRHHDIELVDRHPIQERRFPDWTMAFSSYMSLNSMNMPGFFSVDAEGQNDQTRACSAASA